MFCYSGAWTLDGSAGKDWAGVLSSQEKFQGLWPDGQKMRKNCWLFLASKFYLFYFLPDCSRFDVRCLQTWEMVSRPTSWLVKDYSRIITDHIFSHMRLSRPKLQIKLWAKWSSQLFLFSVSWFACIFHVFSMISQDFSMFFPHLQCFSCDFRGFSHEFPRMSRFAPGDAQQQMALGRLPGPGAPASLSGRGRGRRARTGAFPRSDVRIIPLTMARYGIAYYNYRL